MLSEELYIYKDTYNLCKVLTALVPQVNKLIRYSVWSKIIEYSYLALDTVYPANASLLTRVLMLAKYIYYMLGVKSRIKILGELKTLPQKLNALIIRQINTCLKQANAWKKATQSLESK